MLEECCPRAAAVLEEAEPDALTYLDFPPAHWKRLRTNNVCVPSSKNRQIRLSNFDTLMLTASGRAGAVAAGPPAA